MFVIFDHSICLHHLNSDVYVITHAFVVVCMEPGIFDLSIRIVVDVKCALYSYIGRERDGSCCTWRKAFASQLVLAV